MDASYLNLNTSICSDEELLDALEKLPALDIGIFTQPFKPQKATV